MLLISAGWPRRRLRVADFLVRMCRPPARLCMNFPVPVCLKRFAAAFRHGFFSLLERPPPAGSPGWGRENEPFALGGRQSETTEAHGSPSLPRAPLRQREEDTGKRGDGERISLPSPARPSRRPSPPPPSWRRHGPPDGRRGWCRRFSSPAGRGSPAWQSPPVP